MLAAFDWGYIADHLPQLAHGLVRTLEVAAIGIAGSLVIGATLGAGRAHRVPLLSQLAAVYVEIIRNTPILAQIFLIFYGLPRFGILLSPFEAAWVAVTIWGGAFNTENFRAGFEAVPFSLREGGLALGFTPLKNFLNVTLPVGGRIALPSTINTFIATLKNTALLYVIAYEELTTTAFQIQALTLETLEAWTVLGIVYLTLVWSLSLSIRLLESHLALPEEA